MTGIEQAVAAAGSQGKLADELGVTQQLVSTWVRQGYAPVRWLVPIEQATGVGRARLISPKLADLLSPEV